ncbi:MAG: hypothetical protein GY930_12475 [bacterium]|nr:hypothetical protein [bacterium]
MKRALVVLAAALGLAFAAKGCRAPSIHTSLNVEDPRVQTILPTDRCGDFFIVDVMVDGKGPYPMLLDTGAGTTVLSPRIAEATGISSRMETVAIDDFLATGSIPCRVRKVDHLSRALGAHIEGILAYGVFEGMLLTYDYPAGQIRLQQGGFEAAELESPGYVHTSKGTRPFVRGATDTRDFTILVDTGSSGAVALRKAKRFDLETPLQPTNGHMRINGLFVDKGARLKGNLTIGPINLERPILKKAVKVNLVGQQVLRHFVLTFDQVNHRLRIQRPVGELSDVISMSSIYGLGIVLAPEGDRKVIRRIFEGSAAEAAGLRVDDHIMAIDDEPIGERGCDPKSRMRSAEAQSMELVVERAGERMLFTILTRALIE